MEKNYETSLYNDYEKILKKYDKKSEEYKILRNEYILLKSKYNTELNKNKKIEEKLKEKFEKQLDEKDKEIARLKGLLNLDGTNSGIPTSKTPLNKKKVIPNNRSKSNKKIGGQQGHKKHKLEKFSEEEINEIEMHELEKCPECGGTLKEEKCIEKDELSYEFVVIKRRHKYVEYECDKCHKHVHEKIPTRLKEENQYGSEIKSLALTLGNEGTVSLNRIRKIIKGISHNEIDMSEGFIAKLQKQAASNLEEFNAEINKKLLKERIIYWDDTVISINGKNSCLRFYGNEKYAWYKAHEKKNFDGLEEDNLLNNLSENTIVMHDHNKVNYNKKFTFQNAECNVHLLRDLQKCRESAHTKWPLELSDLIKKALHDKKDYTDKFSDDYIKEFDEKFNIIILEGIEENKNNSNKYYNKEERTLINRILKYKVNYFIWMHDFTIPSDDNMSERALRSAKTKMKVSGQFQNIETAKNYALIKSYIETCNKNGINPTNALIRLCNDKPYTLDEIIKNSETTH